MHTTLVKVTADSNILLFCLRFVKWNYICSFEICSKHPDYHGILKIDLLDCLVQFLSFQANMTGGSVTSCGNLPRPLERKLVENRYIFNQSAF